MVKITVSGFVNEVFIGTDEQAEKYLQNLKKLQESKCDIKEYRKMMPPYKDGFHTADTPAALKWRRAFKRYNDAWAITGLEEFREKMQPFGLKIKIEKANTLPL